MQVKVLGSAAGGGFPQWNCACHCCSGVRSGTIRAKARTQTQIAIGSGGRFLLLDASPDLRMQLESSPSLRPQSAAARNTPIAGVVLTCAELDRTLGLLLLREFQPLSIYSTASVRRILRDTNSMFHMLERENNQARWNEISSPVQLQHFPELRITPVRLPADYPTYVNGLRPELAKDEASLALLIEDQTAGKRILYAPSLPQTSAKMKELAARCDFVFLDGTFWSDDELVQIRGAGKTATAMGHVPMSGPGGTLAWLSDLAHPKKIYIHINNTNPVLDESSAEHEAVMRAGFTLAEDGMEFEL
jgi:pyrroloquinoline quinone biosynthesis protein B